MGTEVLLILRMNLVMPILLIFLARLKIALAAHQKKCIAKIILKNKPGIMIDLRYFIAYVDGFFVIELFNTRYDFACDIRLSIDYEPNTPNGLLTSPNTSNNLLQLFGQCQHEHNIYIANKQQIMTACMRYISQHIHDKNVVNYLIFINQNAYSSPKFSHTYNELFSPKHLIVNTSSVDKSLENIDIPKLFEDLRTEYKKTGRHLHDIQLISESVNNKKVP